MCLLPYKRCYIMNTHITVMQLNWTLKLWEGRKWSPALEVLDRLAFSTCHYYRKCIGNSMGIMHSDFWVLRVKREFLQPTTLWTGIILLKFLVDKNPLLFITSMSCVHLVITFPKIILWILGFYSGRWGRVNTSELANNIPSHAWKLCYHLFPYLSVPLSLL